MWEETSHYAATGCSISFTAITLLKRSSFISKVPQHLPSNYSPRHIPALKSAFKFCTALSTTVLPALPRTNAIGMSISTSLRRERPFLNTLQPALIHPYGHCGLIIQTATIYSKHSALSLPLHSFSEIPSPLPSQQVYHIIREAINFSRRPISIVFNEQNKSKNM